MPLRAFNWSIQPKPLLPATTGTIKPGSTHYYQLYPLVFTALPVQVSWGKIFKWLYSCKFRARPLMSRQKRAGCGLGLCQWVPHFGEKRVSQMVHLVTPYIWGHIINSRCLQGSAWFKLQLWNWVKCSSIRFPSTAGFSTDLSRRTGLLLTSSSSDLQNFNSSFPHTLHWTVDNRHRMILPSIKGSVFTIEAHVLCM